MNATDDRYWHLMTKSFSETLSPEERTQLDNWLAADDANRKLLQELQSIWANTESYGAKVEPDVAQAWENVQHRLGWLEETAGAKGKTKFFRMPAFIKVAAAVLVPAVSGWLLYQAAQQPEMVQVAAAANEQKKVQLPDGSTIWLNQNSSIAFAENMTDQNERHVTLKGEAFFEVAKNKEKPFVIDALDTKTEVVGTSFNIQAREESQAVAITVVTGKVRFGGKAAQETVLLEKGAAAIYTLANHHLQKIDAANTNALFWKTGQLQFNNTTLQEVLNDLSVHYGVQFQLQDVRLANQRITTSFENEKIDNILPVLELLLDVTFDKKGTTYHVH